MGPLLFLIFISYIDVSIGSRICKFADDTKLYRIVDDANDSSLLQSDLDKLISWSHTWQMSFNVSKCKVIRFGSSNLKFNYCMTNTNLDCVNNNNNIQFLYSAFPRMIKALNIYYPWSLGLNIPDDEKDLGVVVSSSLKPSKQCALAALRANRMLGLISRNLCFLGREVVLKLYKQLVRPHLEYAIQAWSQVL